MVWGLVIGFLIGGLIWGFRGAVALGILGLIIGAIRQANRRAEEAPATSSTAAGIAKEIEDDRLTALEKRVVALELELEKLRGAPVEGAVPAVAAVAPPVATTFVEEPVPRPVVEEPVIAKPVVEEPAVAKPAIEEPVAVEAVVPEPVVQESTTPERSLVERLLEGNLVAKIGVVILFFGMAFLLKFAYEHGMFPPGLRLFSVAAASAVMGLVGWRVLGANRTYAVILIGGAMGLLYLDVFFALKTFAMIGPGPAFVLFALLGMTTMGLAVWLDARAVAVLGLLGGFLAPLLASTGSGNHVILFSYYLLLNLVILGVSWFRSWRELNFVGFLFTFAIGVLWGQDNYRPELFATVEPFLLAFFVLYLAIPILFAHRQPPQLRGIVDATLIFGMPLTAAMMQAALTRGMPDRILAWSAAIAAVVYGALARALWNRPNMRLLAESHLALAVVFGTVAPYFAFEGYPTFAFWTLEGAAIFWIGCRQRSILARGFALFLQFAAAGYFWFVTGADASTNPVWNDRVVGCALIAAAALATAWFIHRHQEAVTEAEAGLEPWLLVWSMLWLLLAIKLSTELAFEGEVPRLVARIIAVAVAVGLAEAAGAALEWAGPRMATAAHVPLMALFAAQWLLSGPQAHPLQGAGALAWGLAFAVQFFAVHRQLGAGIVAARPVRYAGAWILMLFLATWEAIWRHDHREHAWVVGIGAVGLVAAGLRYRLREVGHEGAKPRSTWILLWALALWLFGWHGLIRVQGDAAHEVTWHLLVFAGSAALFEWAGARMAWPALRRTQLILPAIMALSVLGSFGAGGHPMSDLRFLGWGATFAALAWALARQERDGIALRAGVQYVFAFLLAVLLVAWELDWQLRNAGLRGAWPTAALGAVVAGAIALLVAGLDRGWPPFAGHAAEFRAGALLPLVIAAALWTLFGNTNAGHAAPLPHIPVLNPLDLAQLALFAATWAAIRRESWPLQASYALGGAAFYWVNAVVLRAVHHWADVPYHLEAMLRSVVAQAALSLIWTATALVAMFMAGRRQSRPMWMAGAALLAIVVLKLFVNDLNNTGTVARIVSFIGVGAFMLLIGWLSPAPPKKLTPPSAADIEPERPPTPRG